MVETIEVQGSTKSMSRQDPSLFLSDSITCRNRLRKTSITTLYPTNYHIRGDMSTITREGHSVVHEPNKTSVNLLSPSDL